MKDSEVRGIVLRKFYDNRRAGWTMDRNQFKAEFGDEVTFPDFYRICEQLEQSGLISPGQRHHVGGYQVGSRALGQITAKGVDVIEGTVTSDLAIKIDQSRHVTVLNSPFVQIGDGNGQAVTLDLHHLIAAIDNADHSPERKADAKNLLQQFLQHPVIASILTPGTKP